MVRTSEVPPSGKESPLETLARECDFEFYRASGPGGQHRNKVETGVRLLHRPSGLRARASERRSRERNRIEALRRLAAKIEERSRKRVPRVPTRKPPVVKARDLAAKKHHADKKQHRRAPDDER